MRNAAGKQLHALAMGEGLCRKKQLFTKKGRCELEALTLDKWASRQRQELLHIVDQLDTSLTQFDQAVNEQAASALNTLLIQRIPLQASANLGRFEGIVAAVMRRFHQRELYCHWT